MLDMKIVIASGKGGTGKTTIATNLAYSIAQMGKAVQYLDCDVEEPNGHIFLKPYIAVDKSEKCILHGQVGTPVSLIPYGSGPFTVRTKGLKYSLGDESLHSATHGLSNELSLTEACVCVSNGILLVHIENEDISFEALQESIETSVFAS